MPAIDARLRDLLDETRLAMLGTQLLIGLNTTRRFHSASETFHVLFAGWMALRCS
jgi:hypothetical protein